MVKKMCGLSIGVPLSTRHNIDGEYLRKTKLFKFISKTKTNQQTNILNVKQIFVIVSKRM